jgi:enhancing lycopene biosynthesis protein 2
MTTPFSPNVKQGITMKQPSIAVVLSGCGHLDGAEIHEATLTLLAIHKHGADYMCFAPDINQHHVINHISGTEMAGERNILIESARIARGKIKDIATFDPQEFDAIVLPGGFGAAKNLSNYAFAGTDCMVNEQVSSAILSMHGAGKPVGALCIAPVILARLIPDVNLTIGQDDGTAAHIVSMGAKHQSSLHGEIVVDEIKKVVTTPCYMLESRVDQIAEGADKLITAILKMI